MPIVTQLLNNPPSFTEPESPLAFSQDPTTVPYHEPDESDLLCFCKMCFHAILQSTPDFSTTNLWISHLPHVGPVNLTILELINRVYVEEYKLWRSTVMMEAEEISETLVFSSTLTRLIAREHFSAFIRCENFKSYIWRSSLCSFLRPPVSPWLLGRNVLLSTLLSYTLIFYSFYSALKHRYPSAVHRRFLLDKPI
jgi:hypothetical protein